MFLVLLYRVQSLLNISTYLLLYLDEYFNKLIE